MPFPENSVPSWFRDFEQLANERPEMHELTLLMVNRMNTKGNDYSAALKKTDNLDEVEEIDIPAWKGVIVRMSDKWSRIKTFALKGVYRVKDETFEDTLLDLAVYCLLCITKWRKAKREAPKESLAGQSDPQMAGVAKLAEDLRKHCGIQPAEVQHPEESFTPRKKSY